MVGAEQPSINTTGNLETKLGALQAIKGLLGLNYSTKPTNLEAPSSKEVEALAESKIRQTPDPFVTHGEWLRRGNLHERRNMRLPRRRRHQKNDIYLLIQNFAVNVVNCGRIRVLIGRFSARERKK